MDSEIRDDTNKRIKVSLKKRMLEYQTIIVSVVTVAVYVLLYSFYASVFSVYHISMDCIRISLTDFLPVVVFAAALFSFWYDYFEQIRIDAIKMKKHINLTRIYKFVIVECILVLGMGLFRLVDNAWFLIALMIILPFAFELLINMSIGVTSSVSGSDKNENNRVERSFNQKWSSHVMVKCFAAIIVIICLMPLCGGVYSRIRNDYQVFKYQGMQYAVIKDFGDDVVAEKCTIKYGCITIDTSEYIFLKKNNMSFEARRFDAVVLDSDTN